MNANQATHCYMLMSCGSEGPCNAYLSFPSESDQYSFGTVVEKKQFLSLSVKSVEVTKEEN